MTTADTLDPTLIGLRAIEADICAGKLETAAVALNALIAASPQNPRVHLVVAMLAYAAKNPAQEILSLQHAVALAPRWPQAYIELAKTLSRQGHHGKAIAAANKAAELAPQDMSALEVAVAVANAAGDPATALRHLQTALALKPGDIAINRALGMCLEKLHRYDEAETHFRVALAENPDDVMVLGWLALVLIGLGRKQEACAMLEHALTLSPDHPALMFHLAVARGETPLTQPMEMIQPLFDGYASRFDAHLQGQLKYRLPERVAEIIRERHPGLDVSILDLGCGTGLLGAHLGRIAGRFVGVDVSLRMLELAVKRDIYTKLRRADLLEELRQAVPDSFDYITANDVFIYVGDLSTIIPAAFKATHSGGALIFSCETADESEGHLVLRPSKRYAHSRSSVENLCREAGFSRCDIEPIDLRMDKDVPIAGFIVVAHKH